MVTEKDVPSYDVIEQKIKEIDPTIIVYRIYYFFKTFIFRFQLLKKDKMCVIELPRELLENLSKDSIAADRAVSDVISLNVENADCWAEFKS